VPHSPQSMPNRAVDSLKKQLSAALKREPIDYDLVAGLSQQFVATDPSLIRFSVDASHITRLGFELVGRQETALAELIKNAFDADAARATLTFDREGTRGGSLRITDDGAGMTLDELINGFMRLSAQTKVNEPVSPRFQRRRAGRKGIGRFATQRLGSKLTVTTQVESERVARRLQIDWDDLEAGTELTRLGSSIEEVPKTVESGTTLVIEPLRDAWSPAALARAYRYVADLVQPFPLGRKKRGVSGKDADPGFTVLFQRRRGGKAQTIANPATAVFQYALATVNASVNSRGRASWSVVSPQLGLHDEGPFYLSGGKKQYVVPLLAGIRLRAYYFIYKREFLPPKVRKSLSELAEQQSGIRIYRNGFRVPPYGAQHDDWAGLNALARSRTFLPAIATKNWFGFVEITDTDGKRFEETSSREGLIENDAFESLRSFTHGVLRAAATRVAEVRQMKVTTTQGDDTPAQRAMRAARALKRSLAAAREEQTKRGGEGLGYPPGLDELADELMGAFRAIGARESALLEELGMLRVLASLGMTIGEFTHEVRQYLPLLEKAGEQLLGERDRKLQRKLAADILKDIRAVRTFTAYFDRAIAENATRELEVIAVREAVHDFLSVVKPDLKRSGIRLEGPEFGEGLIYVRAMHRSEWSSIFFNLFTNAKKAIARANHPGRMLIRAGRDRETVWVEFADNGDGIPLANAERVFNAFFTTATSAIGASVADRVVGSGLGLKIVKDIVVGYGGSIVLAEPPVGYVTCFRIALPAASDEEIANVL
jgi:signal transduction histidine kinase